MSLHIGAERLHLDPNIDFQLARLRSEGSDALRDDARRAAARIRSLETWVIEMLALAGAAEAAGRVSDAARFARAAEFFMDPNDLRKRATYDRFVALFDASRPAAMERHAVPWDGVRLSALRMTPASPCGAIVVCGGFDAFVEDLAAMVEHLCASGFEVVAFDGPGQGAHRGKRALTPDWHGPLGGVLDHFGLRDVSLIGVSLGGCLAVRAAAFEPRVARVVAFDALVDFYECLMTRRGRLVAGAGDALLRLGAGRVLDLALHRLMRADEFARWGLGQGMAILGATSPSAFLARAKRFETASVSHRVRQDVLLLAGAEDHFVPRDHLARQVATLTAARSVTTRLFTREEHGAAHCQVGNLPLALDTITQWIVQPR